MTLDQCPACGERAELVRDRIEFPIGQRIAHIQVERYRCGHCGEAFYTPAQMDDAQRAASNQIREEDGLLLPGDILDIRSRYSLSQADLERVLGVGPKTVVRWERGTVFQNKATDTLLRVLREFPEVVGFLAAQNGVECAIDTMFSGAHSDREMVVRVFDQSERRSSPSDVYIKKLREKQVEVGRVETAPLSLARKKAFA